MKEQELKAITILETYAKVLYENTDLEYEDVQEAIKQLKDLGHLKNTIEINVTDITWDESEVIDLNTNMVIDFPTELLNEEKEEDYEQIISDYVSEAISNETGFCHTGFTTDIDGDINKINSKLS